MSLKILLSTYFLSLPTFYFVLIFVEKKKKTGKKNRKSLAITSSLEKFNAFVYKRAYFYIHFYDLREMKKKKNCYTQYSISDAVIVAFDLGDTIIAIMVS